MKMDTSRIFGSSRPKVVDIDGLMNPTLSELKNFVSRTGYKNSRFILISKKNHLLVWDAKDAIYADVTIPEMGWDPTDHSEMVMDEFHSSGNISGYFALDDYDEGLVIGIPDLRRWKSAEKILRGSTATRGLLDGSEIVDAEDYGIMF